MTTIVYITRYITIMCYAQTHTHTHTTILKMSIMYYAM